MRGKIWLVILLLILMITVTILPVVASISEDECLGPYKKSTTIDLFQTCDTCTFVNISSIRLPNQTIMGFNTSMAKDGITFTSTFSTTDLTGRYYYNVVGDKDNNLNAETLCFTVTSTGFEFTSANSLMYVALLALFIFLLVSIIIGVGKLPANKTRDEEGTIIGASNLKYLRPVFYMVGWAILGGVFFLASNIALAYLGTAMFGNLLFIIYKVLMWSMLPGIVLWLVWIFVQLMQDKEMRNLIERGIPVDGKP